MLNDKSDADSQSASAENNQAAIGEVENPADIVRTGSASESSVGVPRQPVAWFAILPYIYTTKPFRIRGILFRSTEDVSDLPPEAQAHLQTLCSMFYVHDELGLRTDLHITKMVYAYLPMTEVRENNQQIFRRMKEAHILLTYLYCRPHSTMAGLLDRPELYSLYLFRPGWVFRFSVWTPRDGVRAQPNNPEIPTPYASETKKGPIDGYRGWLNWNIEVEVVPGSHIYPPARGIYATTFPDVAQDLEQRFQRHETWAIQHLADAYQPELGELEPRLFSSLEWYNRSGASNIGEDVALVSLVTAFESLLGLSQGKEHTERFGEAVQVLIGFIPRLDSVLEQLYDARSKIVHRGSWPHLRFYATERAKYPAVVKGDKEAPAHQPLIIYGWRIFRICFITLLSGAIQAAEAELAASFFHNQERLEQIARVLHKRELPADARIMSVRKEVVELLQQQSGLTEDGVSWDRLLDAGVQMVQAFSELQATLPDGMQQIIDAICAKGAAADVSTQLDRFEQLGNVLDELHGSKRYYQFDYGYSTPGDPITIVQILLSYIALPHFRLRFSWPLQ